MLYYRGLCEEYAGSGEERPSLFAKLLYLCVSNILRRRRKVLWQGVGEGLRVPQQDGFSAAQWSKQRRSRPRQMDISTMDSMGNCQLQTAHCYAPQEGSWWPMAGQQEDP